MKIKTLLFSLLAIAVSSFSLPTMAVDEDYSLDIVATQDQAQTVNSIDQADAIVVAQNEFQRTMPTIYDTTYKKSYLTVSLVAGYDSCHASNEVGWRSL